MGRRLSSATDVTRALAGMGRGDVPIVDLTATTLADPSQLHPLAQRAVSLARTVPTAAQLMVVARGDRPGETEEFCVQLQQSVRELAPFEPLTVVAGLGAATRAPIGVVVTMCVGETTVTELRRVVSDVERSLQPILGVMLYRSLNFQPLSEFDELNVRATNGEGAAGGNALQERDERGVPA